MTQLCLALAGLSGALAFPFTAPGIGPTPVGDALPRELLAAAPVAALVWIVRSPQTLRRRSLAAWWVGFWFFVGLIYWLSIAMCRFGGLSPALAWPLLAALMGFCALFWAAIPALCDCLMQLGCSLPVSLATAFVAVDWARGEGAGFPWGWLGYSQARHLPLAQLASWGGVSLVTWWVVCAAACVALGCLERTVSKALVCALATLYAAGCLLFWLPVPNAPPLRVAVAQGNIEQDIKNNATEHEVDIFNVYRELSARAVADGADQVVWPEAALPGWLDISAALPFAMRLPVPLLFGAATWQPGPPADIVRNSALYMAPDGLQYGRYDKRHLVPFGEYVPLRRWLPIDRLVPGSFDIAPGSQAVNLGPGADIGALVCYDGVFTAYAREAVRAGARVIVNFTNDAWYGISGAPYQHRDFYVFRAIESGRWVIRATNTGISTFIDPRGRQSGTTALGVRQTVVGTVTRQSAKTFFVRVGDWWMAGCVGLCLAALVRCRRVC